MKRGAILAAVLAAGFASADAPKFPVTIEKVWLHRQGAWFHKGGDLVVTKEGLEFLAGKRNVSISMNDIYMVSFGQMRGDVDTEWVVIATGKEGPAEIYGVRDGKKLGYGRRTDEIHELLLSALRRAGAGQYRVPPGHRSHDTAAFHCTFAVPEPWHAYEHEIVVVPGGTFWSDTVFSPAEIEPPRREDDDPLGRLVDDPELTRVMDGETAGFFVSRRPADGGMTCDGLSKKARNRIVDLAGRARVEERGWELVGEPKVTRSRLAMCEGLRIEAGARRPDGEPVTVVVRAAAHGGALFLVGRHFTAEAEAGSRAAFSTAVETFRMAVAR